MDIIYHHGMVESRCKRLKDPICATSKSYLIPGFYQMRLWFDILAFAGIGSNKAP